MRTRSAEWIEAEQELLALQCTPPYAYFLLGGWVVAFWLGWLLYNVAQPPWFYIFCVGPPFIYQRILVQLLIRRSRKEKRRERIERDSATQS